MMVLSIMGGYANGQLVGTAPHARYWLIRTEDASSEQLVEEYNWAAGAEFADSAGADIINTSLDTPLLMCLLKTIPTATLTGKRQ